MAPSILPPKMGTRREAVPMQVSDERAAKFLGLGWTLSDEDSDWKAPEPPKSEPRELEVKKINDGEDSKTGNGLDLTALPSGHAVTAPIVQDDRRKVAPADPTNENLPGLAGKTREVLLGIAAAEGIEVPDAITKPQLKALIESKRSGEEVVPDESDTDDEDTDGLEPIDDDESSDDK